MCPLGTGYNSLRHGRTNNFYHSSRQRQRKAVLAQSGERQRLRKRRLREGKRGRQRTGIAREGFLDRRSKRCFWLLLSPQTKVAHAGARNSPCAGCGRDEGVLRRCAATPHLPPSGASVSLRVGRSAGLTRHRRVIQHRGPLKGKANGGVSFNTAAPSRGRLGTCGRVFKESSRFSCKT